ncbi:MAG: 2OG-Fe(II) oxygenase [Kofleriaceae bacterium]
MNAALGRAHAAAFRDAAPYPHVVIDNFLGARAREIADAMPAPDHAAWKRQRYPEQVRLNQLQKSGFAGCDPALQQFLLELNAMPMLEFLGALTGRRDLIGDPFFVGAGPMLTLRGGHLAIHTDFNRDSARHLDRVLSILYYVPRAWDPSWGGALELWDRERTHCIKRIEPVLDRMVVMAYGDDHWHGHPTPLECPDHAARAVVTAHYFAARYSPSDDAEAHGAKW